VTPADVLDRLSIGELQEGTPELFAALLGALNWDGGTVHDALREAHALDTRTSGVIAAARFHRTALRLLGPSATARQVAAIVGESEARYSQRRAACGLDRVAGWVARWNALNRVKMRLLISEAAPVVQTVEAP
jgi:hypothetical protein